MTDFVRYRIIGDMSRICTTETFHKRMREGLFDSNEIVDYVHLKSRNSAHYKTLEEQQIAETPAKSEGVVV